MHKLRLIVLLIPKTFIWNNFASGIMFHIKHVRISFLDCEYLSFRTVLKSKNNPMKMHKNIVYLLILLLESHFTFEVKLS